MNDVARISYRVIAVLGTDPATRKTIDLQFGSHEAARRCRELCARRGYAAAIKIEPGALIQVRA